MYNLNPSHVDLRIENTPYGVLPIEAVFGGSLVENGSGLPQLHPINLQFRGCPKGETASTYLLIGRKITVSRFLFDLGEASIFVLRWKVWVMKNYFIQIRHTF